MTLFDRACVGLVGLLVMMGVMMLYITYNELPNHDTEKIDIVSMETVNGTYGNFTFGSGQINNKEYFVCYAVLEDGAKRLIKIPADESKIYDTITGDDKPYVELRRTKGGNIISGDLHIPNNYIINEYGFNEYN